MSHTNSPQPSPPSPPSLPEQKTLPQGSTKQELAELRAGIRYLLSSEDDPQEREWICEKILADGNKMRLVCGKEKKVVPTEDILGIVFPKSKPAVPEASTEDQNESSFIPQKIIDKPASIEEFQQSYAAVGDSVAMGLNNAYSRSNTNAIKSRTVQEVTRKYQGPINHDPGNYVPVLCGYNNWGELNTEEGAKKVAKSIVALAKKVGQERAIVCIPHTVINNTNVTQERIKRLQDALRAACVREGVQCADLSSIKAPLHPSSTVQKRFLKKIYNSLK